MTNDGITNERRSIRGFKFVIRHSGIEDLPRSASARRTCFSPCKEAGGPRGGAFYAIHRVGAQPVPWCPRRLRSPNLYAKLISACLSINQEAPVCKLRAVWFSRKKSHILSGDRVAHAICMRRGRRSEANCAPCFGCEPPHVGSSGLVRSPVSSGM